MGDSPRALDEALAATVRGTGASAGGLYLLAADEPVLKLVVLCGVPTVSAAPWWRVPLVAGGPISGAVCEDRLVWVGRQEEMARDYPRAAAGLPYRFALAVAPLTGVRHRWGALLLLWPATRPPELTPRERGHIVSSARRIARLLDESPRPPDVPDQPRVVTAHRPGAGPPQPGLAAADLVERLPVGAVSLDLEGRVTFLNTAAATLLGRGADQLMGTLPWQSLPWLDDPVYEDHYRTAILSREPVAYAVLRPPDRWLEFRLYPDDSGISALIAPGRSGARPRDTAPPLGSAAPGSGGGAVAGRVHQLMHLAAALTESVGVRDVIDLVADQVLPAFGAQGMVLSAAEGGRLRITGYRGYSPRAIERLDGLPLDTELTPAGQVLSSGSPAFYATPEELARTHPQASALSGKQAWAFLPLIISQRPVGCCVLSYDRPHTFTAGERAVLTSLAGLIAQALDRARLYDAKQDLAHGLQQSLLPRTLPVLPGLNVAARYLPATHGMDIGGDFYDLIRLGDTAAAAVIGDVQGHNVSAAALMGQVRTAVHAHATAGAAPGEVLARTNRVLADLETDLFVSCLYVHLDLADRRVALASAGHPPPLLRLPGVPPRARVLDVEPGPLLGVGVQAPYPVTSLRLPVGALLALYTDGLVEVPGTDLARTTEALARHLADAGDLPLDRLIDSMVATARPTRRHVDDIALLLLEATERPG
ncbi:SpoIIE family protein phosphatase [Streptomyces capparidis]